MKNSKRKKKSRKRKKIHKEAKKEKTKRKSEKEMSIKRKKKIVYDIKLAIIDYPSFITFLSFMPGYADGGRLARKLMTAITEALVVTHQRRLTWIRGKCLDSLC
ncbi:30249_t:CDS:1 [Racocetra persica]|uniref:30249_t:CDS:1 n=1 Tax=Racocetra persica TaxID=160502 RepID=A0ACA9KCV1_9GLOM|nr:30249_t:CDS:1 [Racocetra persica]